MENKLITGMVAAAVVVILIAGILIPALGNATDTHDTFTNEGLYRMEKINSSSDFVLKWEYSSPNQLTLNDEVVPLQAGTMAMTVLYIEDVMLRIENTFTSITLFGAKDPLPASSIMTASVNDTTDLTVTASSGTITFTNGTDTESYTMTDGMVASLDGDYVMKASSYEAYMNGDSEFYVAGYTYRALGVAYTNFVGIFQGTIDDGVSAIAYTPGTYVTSDPELTYSPVDNYSNFYKFTGFKIGLTNGEDTGTLTYTQLIVPLEVNAEKAQHLTDSQIMILDVIPLLLIVAVLLGVVAVFILRRE